MKEIALTVTTSEKDVSGRELLQNLMPVKSTGGKYPFKLVSTPGKTLFSELPTSPVLGMHKANNRGFAATATRLYELAEDGTYTERGTWALVGRVSMAFNGTHLVAVDGSTGWVYNVSTDTLSQITDPAFYPSDKVSFQDGFFVFNRTGTGQYFISDLYSTDLDALNFATAEGNPDFLVSHIADHNEIFLFGTDSTEVIYTSGGGDFPFDKNRSAYVEKGCAAKHTVAKANNSVYFVGSDLMVYEMRGYVPQRISTDAIEADLQDTPLDSTFGYTYHERGQIFYVLTIPPLLKTWVFETTTRTWHQRKSNTQGRDISNCVMFFGNKTLVGDWQNGNIYHLSRQFNSELTQPIIRRLRLPTITSGRRYVTVSALEFDMKRGVGTISGDDANPVAWLRYSKDGGNTWSVHPDYPSLGRLGEHFVRIRFDRLGTSREFDFELNISHSVDVEIGGAYIDAA